MSEKIIMPLCYDINTKTFNAHSIIISNVADPVDDNDVVTLDFLKQYKSENTKDTKTKKIKNEVIDKILEKIKEFEKNKDIKNEDIEKVINEIKTDISVFDEEIKKIKEFNKTNNDNKNEKIKNLIFEFDKKIDNLNKKIDQQLTDTNNKIKTKFDDYKKIIEEVIEKIKNLTNNDSTDDKKENNEDNKDNKNDTDNKDDKEEEEEEDYEDYNNKIKEYKNLFDNVDIRIKELNNILKKKHNEYLFSTKYVIDKSDTGGFIMEHNSNDIKPFANIEINSAFLNYYIDSIVFKYEFYDDKNQLMVIENDEKNLLSKLTLNISINNNNKFVIENNKIQEQIFINKLLNDLTKDSIFKIVSSTPVNLISIFNNNIVSKLKTINIFIGYSIKVFYIDF